MSENLHCLRCHKAQKETLKFLEDHFGSDKVFVGFIKDNIAAIHLSSNLEAQHLRSFAEALKDIADEL
jgi:hypothetical protein